MPLKIYSDGGARGNPGPAAFAVVVCKDGKIIHQHSEYIGVSTNNVAEYRGLIYAAGYAIDSREDDVEFIMDSKLAVEQMKGNYKVRSKNLIDMHHDVKAMVSNIRNVKFRHVKRSDAMIAVADALLNRTMDDHLKII
ncbi:MAG: ribonuclease HI family protein [Methanomassiliicoccaceae archaeon]|jgi:ribonuclease HI|nr:ribonuclease HI family protein [Methanomassiliicoccaceae archaeon]